MKGSSFCEKVSLDSRGNSYFVDFGVKTYVSIYQEPASGVGYSVLVPPMLFDPGMANSFTGMENTYPLNTGFLPSTELQSSKKLPTTSSLHNPTKLHKKCAKKKQKRQTNLHCYTKHSSRAIFPDNFPPCPGFPLSTTRPLCLVLRQSRHCQSRSAGGSGATWRGTSLKRRTNTQHFSEQNLTNKKWLWCFLRHVYGLSHTLMAMVFQEASPSSITKGQGYNKSSLCSNPFHPFPKSPKIHPTESLLGHLSTRGFRLPKKMFVSCDPHLIFLHNIRICFAVKSCVFYFRSLPPMDALEENLLGL